MAVQPPPAVSTPLLTTLYTGDRHPSAAESSLHGERLTRFGKKQLYVPKFLDRGQGQAALPPDGPKCTNLYIKNMGSDLTDDNLRAKFSEFGRVCSAVIMKDGLGRSKGFGFVSFQEPEQAQKAMDAMNGSMLGSMTIYVGPAQKKEEREKLLKEHFGDKYDAQRPKMIQDSNVYVKFLQYSVDDKALRQHFLRCGRVVSAKVMRLKNGMSRGFGFVCFSSPCEANKAVTTLHGTQFCGRRLYVALAERKEDRRKRLQPPLGYYPQYYSSSAYYPQYYNQPLHYLNFPYQDFHCISKSNSYPQQLLSFGNNKWANTTFNSSPDQSVPYVSSSHHCVPNVHPAKAIYPVQQNGYMVYGNMNQGYVQAPKPLLYQRRILKKVPQLYICESGSKSAHHTEGTYNASVFFKEQKQLIGQYLYPKVQQPEMKHAPKTTGMLMEMSGPKLYEKQLLADKVESCIHDPALSVDCQGGNPSSEELLRVEPGTHETGFVAKDEGSSPSSEGWVKVESDDNHKKGPVAEGQGGSPSSEEWVKVVAEYQGGNQSSGESAKSEFATLSTAAN